MREGINFRQIFVGLNILIIGVLYYFFFRNAEQTYFFKFFENTPQPEHYLPPMLVALGNSLPTFVHVFAFSLITAGLFVNGKKGFVVVCVFWFTIDVLFELGQAFNSMVVSVIPDWFSDLLLLENTKNYFLHGRFDYLDMLSIAVGSVLAYLFLIKTKIPVRTPNEEKYLSNC